MPKSYLSEAEKAGLTQNSIYIAESAAADRAGDEDAAWEWLKLADIPADALLSAKHRRGADWVRSTGLKLDSAERVYGKDWLDRNI